MWTVYHRPRPLDETLAGASSYAQGRQRRHERSVSGQTTRLSKITSQVSPVSTRLEYALNIGCASSLFLPQITSDEQANERERRRVRTAQTPPACCGSERAERRQKQAALCRVLGDVLSSTYSEARDPALSKLCRLKERRQPSGSALTEVLVLAWLVLDRSISSEVTS